MKQRRASLVLGAVLVALIVVLVLGRSRSDGPETVTTRADRIAAEIRCPTCQGQSVKESKAASAREIYAEVTRQVEAGETDANIRGYLVSRFGASELLRPKSTGIASVVWIAPVMFLVGACAFLLRIFLRTRQPALAVTNEDRRLVDEALHLHQEHS